MVYSAHVKAGLVVFDQPVTLPEGLEVRVEVPETTPPAAPDAKEDTPGRRLLKYAGKAVGLPVDAARNHDHYLYGAAKR
jgi:hypothetical protein